MIADDDSDMLEGQNFVQTDFQTGLTDEDVNNMKAFLEVSRWHERSSTSLPYNYPSMLFDEDSMHLDHISCHRASYLVIQ